MFLRKYIHFLGSMLLLMACSSHPEMPEAEIVVDNNPWIFPDYTNVTVPSNIAPVNFMTADSTYSDIVAQFVAADGTTYTYGKDNKVIIPQKEWNSLKEGSVGKSIKVTVAGKKNEGNVWVGFKTFDIFIAKEPIDDYISYRLIEPGYMLYNNINISQRQLSSFRETEMFNNQVARDGTRGQCINCHSYQNYGTDNMLFHVRVSNGGTVIVVDGKPRKVDLKRPYTISAGVYPAWHPTEKLIAFSTDNTHQWFHTGDPNKVEVFDDASDLILYDVKKDSVHIIAADTTRLEVFPTWSPDGKYLYYCSTDAWKNNPDIDYRSDYVESRYNVYRKSFDLKTLSFGEEEIVYQADTLKRSASLPRISPDGRYLTFAEGDYGYFNIWHHEADIRIMSLETDEPTFIDASALNTPNYAESYPSWSSNGRWIMCASRRDDGNYSRVYISYFDGDRIHKAFELPQEDPEHNTMRLKSYNRPEFMKEPVKLSIGDFATVVKGK